MFSFLLWRLRKDEPSPKAFLRAARSHDPAVLRALVLHPRTPEDILVAQLNRNPSPLLFRALISRRPLSTSLQLELLNSSLRHPVDTNVYDELFNQAALTPSVVLEFLRSYVPFSEPRASFLRLITSVAKSPLVAHGIGELFWAYRHNLGFLVKHLAGNPYISASLAQAILKDIKPFRPSQSSIDTDSLRALVNNPAIEYDNLFSASNIFLLAAPVSELKPETIERLTAKLSDAKRGEAYRRAQKGSITIAQFLHYTGHLEVRKPRLLKRKKKQVGMDSFEDRAEIKFEQLSTHVDSLLESLSGRFPQESMHVIDDFKEDFARHLQQYRTLKDLRSNPDETKLEREKIISLVNSFQAFVVSLGKMNNQVLEANVDALDALRFRNDAYSQIQEDNQLLV